MHEGVTLYVDAYSWHTGWACGVKDNNGRARPWGWRASEACSRVWRMKELMFPALLLYTEVSWKRKAVTREDIRLGKTFLDIMRLVGSLVLSLASPRKWWALWGQELLSGHCCIASRQARLAQGRYSVRFWANQCFHYWLFCFPKGHMHFYSNDQENVREWPLDPIH